MTMNPTNMIDQPNKAASPRRWLLLAALVAAVATGCTSSPTEGDMSFSHSFNFTQGDRAGWSAGLTDFPGDSAGIGYAFTFGVRDLPAEIGTGKGLYLSSMNRSDDLFMFLKREITGLKPKGSYHVTLKVKLASNAHNGCVGVGGAPGESVYLKTGASTAEPVGVTRGDETVLSVDKGQQSTSGRNAVVAGDVANGLPCDGTAVYRVIERSNQRKPISVTADAAGKLWVFVGTDSAFEGLTSLYYTQIEVAVVEK